MTDYKTVMLAVDLTEESLQVAERAIQLVQAFAAQLHIVHVIEPLSLAYGGDVPMDLSTVQEQIHEQATSHLREFSATLEIPEAQQHLIFGRPESEIQRTAKEVGADVIVVGSHGRHGLALLLGSTANGVLHGATCDVLAVRVGNDETHSEE
ncbi:MAG: universal stress protein [Gammaproteobacteria bacterium TMED92]|nr:MAG: universal stress protein [Gammaproteobacteria bacterium TMED92]